MTPFPFSAAPAHDANVTALDLCRERETKA
jgi:hypothetical protein